MPVLAAILALLTGVAGWFYMFHSRAAAGLIEVEDRALNARRVRLRRIGGFVMLALGAMFYVAAAATEGEGRPGLLFVIGWLSVMCLLAALVVLALVDVRLTLRLRRRQRQPPNRGHGLDRTSPP